jgi:hypothetical protein
MIRRHAIPDVSKGGVRVKKRLIVLLALAAVIAGVVATTASAILVDSGSCRVYHVGHIIYDAGCDD